VEGFIHVVGQPVIRLNSSLYALLIKSVFPLNFANKMSNLPMHEANTAIHPLAILKPTKQPRLHTLEQYLRREEGAMERHEYYDGRIIKLPMTRGPHNEIAANVISALKTTVKLVKNKYRVFSSNQLVYLPELNFGLYPGALVVCEKPTYWDNNQVLMTNPVLIVEVLSKSTRTYDRTEKFSEYKSLPSFQEYVLIKPDRCSVETRFREEPDLWRDTRITDLSASLLLRSLGCSILLADIYENIEFEPPRRKAHR